jgi:hypothetical protein
MDARRLSLLPLLCGILVPTASQASPHPPLPTHQTVLPASPHPALPNRQVLIKDGAKAKFGTAELDQQRLQEAKLQAARGQYENRERQYLGGQGVLCMLFDAAQRLLEAELGCTTDNRSRMTAFERYWQQCLLINRINQARFEAFRVSTKDYRETTYQRLGAEMELARARTCAQIQSPVGGSRLQISVETTAKQYARAKFQAWHGDPNQWAEDMVAAAYDAFRARLRVFLAGQGTLDILLAASRRCLEADLQRNKTPADRLTAYVRQWESTRFIEAINKRRFEAGLIALQDFLQSTHSRADAELQWLRARSSLRGAEAAAGPSWGTVESRRSDPTIKALARAKFMAIRSDAAGLMRTRYEAVRREYQERIKQYFDGQGTLDILLESSQNLVAAELEMCDSHATRLLALEGSRRRSIPIEAVNRRRYEARKIAVQDLWEATYFQVDAHLRLLQERARKR